jgi:hypothetical protein
MLLLILNLILLIIFLLKVRVFNKALNKIITSLFIIDIRSKVLLKRIKVGIDNKSNIRARDIKRLVFLFIIGLLDYRIKGNS